METIHTVACKLDLSHEQRQHVADTMQAFAKACQSIEDTLPKNIRNKDRMQTLIYRDIRDRFGLSANLAIRAIARVAANRKAAAQQGETIKAFAPTSIDYDQRIFSFRERDWTVSLSLLHGRERFSMRLGDYQRRRLQGQTPTSAQLCRHRSGVYFLHIQVKDPAPTSAEPTDVLGVDLGRIDIAHTSDDQDWNGQDLKAVRDRYSRLRAALQKKASKGTRSTRRRCRQLPARLSGHEHRFQRHTNHDISKTLVANALASGRALALEDLTGIRERTNQEPRPKTERRRSNSWAFAQLRQYVRYKALAVGVVLHLVPAAYTSQMCHVCLHIGTRKGKQFACTNPACGWHGDSDLNGARNIRTLGLHVGQARGPWLHCSLNAADGLLKAQAL